MKELTINELNNVQGGAETLGDIFTGGLQGAAIGGRLGAFGGPAGAVLGITYGFLLGMVIAAADD